MGYFKGNWKQFLRGTGMTLLISMVGTITGLFIGLLIGIFRTAPKAKHKVAALGQNSLVGYSLFISKSSVGHL